MEGHHPHPHPHHPLYLHRQQQHQPQQHHHQQQQQQHSIGGVTAAVNVVEVGDRFPQWSIQETQEFLTMRAELDQAFMETKRNKQLWEVISNRMKEKGYLRSPEQCKCKWKNLITRYKGCETREAEALRQHFPFYNELQLIFASRMQRMLWAEAEGGGGGGLKKKALENLSSEDEEEEEDNNNNKEESEGDQKGTTSRSRKKKKKKGIKGSSSGNYSSINESLKNMKEILKEFMRQQMQMEEQWREAYEAREKERRMKELEWRQTMEALENEKIMMDQRWREREDQRRFREEGRAEKRDALVTALLNKLSREDM